MCAHYGSNNNYLFCIFPCFRLASKLFTIWASVACISASLTYAWLRYKEGKSGFTKVLIYRPFRKKKCNCRINFDSQCQDIDCSSIQTKEIIKCLQQAEKSIDVCVFSISNKPLSSEIISAHQRGIMIRVVVSNCILLEQSKELQRFRTVGIEIKYQKNWSNSYMHNKYAIVDTKWLIQGSLNWTHQATFDNWENVIITDSPSLVKAYSMDFENIWMTINL